MIIVENIVNKILFKNLLFYYNNEHKEELINLIKQWIDADNNIKKLQDAVKEKKEEKKNLTEDLLKNHERK